MTAMPEYWMLTWPIAGRTAQVAKLCEASGWDGLLVTDTQCLAAEAFVQLSMCVAATTRLKLGTGVTNPVTRDAAVLASAFASLQQESNGRMTLGIGRGDSSLAHIEQIARIGCRARNLRRPAAELFTRRASCARRLSEPPSRVVATTEGAGGHRRHRQTCDCTRRAACRWADARCRRKSRTYPRQIA
jgi:hypothetical protein